MGNVYNIKTQGAIAGAGQQNSAGLNLGSVMTTSSQGLNLNSINGNIGDLLKQITPSGHIKKYEVYESEEDFLALSVAWYRLRKEKDAGKLIGYINISSLTDQDLYKCVTSDDRIKAEEIRDFYQKKFLMLTLKSKPLTMFRKDLCEYVNGNSKIVQEKLLPMIYRLPEFYEYDIDFDDLKRDFNHELNEQRVQGKPRSVKKLFPIRKLSKNTKRMKYHEYWMHTPDNDLVVMVLDLKNPLQHLWEKEFDKQFISIEAYYMPKVRDDLQYYQLGNWQVV